MLRRQINQLFIYLLSHHDQNQLIHLGSVKPLCILEGREVGGGSHGCFVLQEYTFLLAGRYMFRCLNHCANMRSYNTQRHVFCQICVVLVGVHMQLQRLSLQREGHKRGSSFVAQFWFLKVLCEVVVVIPQLDISLTVIKLLHGVWCRYNPSVVRSLISWWVAGH